MQLRLLAPFLPYVTEEVWSWWQEGSVHRAAWPTVTELGSPAASDGTAIDAVAAALAVALHVQLRLLAPFLPYATEEVWSWWQEGSIHHTSWPVGTDLGAAAAADPTMVDAVAAALIGIRGAKSQAKVSMKAELSRVEISGPPSLVSAAEGAAADLRRAGKITGDLVFTPDESAQQISVAADVATATA